MLIGAYFTAETILSFIKKLIELVFSKVAIKEVDTKSTNHRYIWIFAVLAMLYVGICIIRFPGSPGYDENLQIANFLAGNITSAHWPPATTVFMGGIVWIGNALFGSMEAGRFLLIIVQSIIVAAALTNSIRVAERFGISRKYTTFMLIVFVLSPTYFLWTTQICKDCIYSAFVVFFISILAEYLYFEKTIQRELLIGVTGLLFSLTRKNGIFIVYAFAIVLAISFLTRRKYARLLIVIASVICLNTAYNSLLLPAFNIKPGSIREAFAVPFQQTARTAKRYSEDATEEEKEAINAVLNYDGIIESYNPSNVDPVKDYFHADNDSDALKQYFKVWFGQFLKHPLTYIDATIANTYQYFYPDALQHNLSRDSFYGYDWVGEINGNHSEGIVFPNAKLAFAQYVFIAESFPILSMISNSAVLLLLTIYLTLYLLAHKEMRTDLLLVLPSIVGILVCIAGPTFVNHGNRYALPVVWPALMLAGILLKNRCNFGKAATAELKVSSHG